MPGSTYAIIVGVEKYQQPSISGVPFAEADARAIKTVLEKNLGVPSENIQIWHNGDATRSVLENDLPYTIQQRSTDDIFISSYAGDGFYLGGHNRITT